MEARRPLKSHLVQYSNFLSVYIDPETWSGFSEVTKMTEPGYRAHISSSLWGSFPEDTGYKLKGRRSRGLGVEMRLCMDSLKSE